jgi:glucose-6-phosphate dehydrogenase assembly protein OpcA
MPAAVVKPEALLKDLQAEWVKLGKAEAESSDRSAGVLRAVTMTVLVAVEAGPEEVKALETLSQLMHEHPARAIVLRLLPDADADLEGRAYTTCWMPFGRRSQICCEQIELSAGAANYGQMPRLLQGLVAPDLPVVLWCRSASVFRHEAFAALADMADKVILDSRYHPDPDATVRYLDAQLRAGHHCGDLTWTRLTRWRQTIAAAFERPDCRSFFDSLTGAEIHYAHRPEPVSARYLRAWLQSVLGAGFPVKLVHSPVEPDATWQIRKVTFHRPGGSFDIERPQKGSAEIHVESFTSKAHFDVLDEPSLLREEIAILGRDTVFQRTVRQFCLSL